MDPSKSFNPDTRYAIVDGGGASDRVLKQVEAYLPSNYFTIINANHDICIQGVDDHGWTLDGYVIPRLASGLIVAKEIASK